MVIEQSGFSSMIQEKGQAKNIFNVIFEDPWHSNMLPSVLAMELSLTA